MEVTHTQFMAMVARIAPALFRDANPDHEAARQAIIAQQRAAMEAAGFVIMADTELPAPRAATV